MAAHLESKRPRRMRRAGCAWAAWAVAAVAASCSRPSAPAFLWSAEWLACPAGGDAMWVDGAEGKSRVCIANRWLADRVGIGCG